MKESWDKKIKMKKVGLLAYRETSSITKKAESFQSKTFIGQSLGTSDKESDFLLKYYDTIEETPLTSSFYLFENKS